MTARPSVAANRLVISSVIPSVKYSSSGEPRFSNGSTTILIDSEGFTAVAVSAEPWSGPIVRHSATPAKPTINAATTPRINGRFDAGGEATAGAAGWLAPESVSRFRLASWLRTSRIV